MISREEEKYRKICTLLGVSASKTSHQIACPCHKDNNPSFSLEFKNNRTLYKCHAGCTQDSLTAHFRSVLDLGNDKPTRTLDKRELWIKTIIAESCHVSSPEAAIAKRYLMNRGLSTENLPDTVSFHSSLFVQKGLQAPGLVLPTPSGHSIQRIFLTRDGHKLPNEQSKKLLGSLQGEGIHFGTLGSDIAVGEGPETCLAIHQITGIPTLCGVNASNMAALTIPTGVKKIWICADHDEAGLNAANKLQAKLINANIASTILVPPDHGKDFLDLLNEHGKDAVLNAFKEAKEPALNFPDIVEAAAVTPKTMEYLIEPYIPKNKVTLLCGESGVGKSYFTCYIASRISNGQDINGNTIQDGSKVLFFNAEDDISDTIVPRLLSMKADMAKISCGSESFDLSREDEKSAFIARVSGINPSLLIIDPIQCFLGPKISMSNANQVRSIMKIFYEVAQRTETTVIVVGHLSKAKESNIKSRALGSIDFMAAVRSALGVVEDPRDETNRIVYHIKANTSAKGDPLSYSIEDAKFQFKGTSDLSENEYASLTSFEEMSKITVAKEILGELIEEHNGSVDAEIVHEKARKAGISEATMRRARVGLRIDKRKEKSKWVWFNSHDALTP
jgi:DNA repair protein RadA/Sms